MTLDDSGLKDKLLTIRRTLGITLTNECANPHNQIVTVEPIKSKGLGPQIVHGRLLRNVTLETDTLHVPWDCCAVLMEDEMIIGLDFMEANDGIINIKEGTLSIQGKTLPVKLISNPYEGLHSSLVWVQRTEC